MKYLTKGIELLKSEEKDEIRKLSKAYCNIAELYMTDLCMDKDAQQKCHVSPMFIKCLIFMMFHSGSCRTCSFIRQVKS